MSADGKLMDMLTGYAASHQHPVNIFVHMIGIPTIMLGVLIPLSWFGVELGGWTITLAHAVLVGFFLFYLSLDALFAVVFLVCGYALTLLAAWIASHSMPVAGTTAAILFFGGYLAQFIGHAIEKSMPVLVKHPIQANLAAPFFTVVELFKILGLRDELFLEVQQQIEARRQEQAEHA
jgi:uncharacterized membrane protein YGL010W